MSKGTCPFNGKDCFNDCAIFSDSSGCCSLLRMPFEISLIYDAVVAQGERITEALGSIASSIDSKD